MGSSLGVSVRILIFLHVHFTRLVLVMCILLLEQNMEGHLLLFIDVVEGNSLLVGLVFFPWSREAASWGKVPQHHNMITFMSKREVSAVKKMWNQTVIIES